MSVVNSKTSSKMDSKHNLGETHNAILGQVFS